ncbi:MAG: phosphoribosylglycinamide formyltransferase [Microbacterium sp.]|nr:MAG: phosphoribosylglycinamide formyltransferase [Microbacterium sp.]
MPHPLMFDDADPLLVRLRTLALALPEAVEKVTHGRPTFSAERVFAYYGGSRRGDTTDRHDTALLVRPDLVDEPALRQDARFFEPSYLWPHGWLALDLGADTDWDEVAELLDASYRRAAPRRLVALLDSPSVLNRPTRGR